MAADNLQRTPKFPETFETAVDRKLIAARAKEILTDPKGVWPGIRAEQDSVAGIYRKYLLVMAAIPAICGYVGMVVFGISLPFGAGTFRWPVFSGLVNTIATYVLSLALIFIAAKIVQALAPKFGGQISEVDAVKTVGYSMTPGFVAGFFSILPALAILGSLLSLYGLYVFFQGLKQMTGVPEDKFVGFYVVTLVANLFAALVLGAVTAFFTPTPAPPAINTAGVAANFNVNTDELEQSVKHFQKAFNESAAAGK